MWYIFSKKKRGNNTLSIPNQKQSNTLKKPILFFLLAPSTPKVLDFFRIVLGIPLSEGYGQTENCAGCAISLPGDYRSGPVGPPLPSCEIKLIDVPTMNYFVNDQPNPRGEICLRGPIVTPGYYKLDKITKETIDDEGWLHTYVL